MSQLNPGETSPWRRAAVPAAVVLATLAVVGLRPQDYYDASVAAPGQAVRLEAAPRRTSHAALEIEAAEAEAATPTKPHIILFTVDDMGWNDIGYTSTDLPEATPHMTALAAKGVKLTHYYSQPSCTPSRVAMMTGKFPYKNGFQNYELQFSDGVGVPLSNKLMPAALKELGYATAMLGKWNIGHCNEAYLPHERGFDSFLGYMCPGHGYRDFNCGMGAGYKDMLQGSALLTASGAVEHRWSVGSAYEGTYDTLLYRDKAGALVRAHARAAADASPTGADPNAAPLFLWAAQHGIHSEDDSEPEPPDDLLSAENKAYLKVLELKMNKATAENDDLFMKMRKLTASVLMSIDNSLKNLVDTLEDEGMLSNTVLFVNSDNGGDTLYAKGHPGNNFPMRSLKFSYYEGGVRVPAFVFAPGIVPEARQGSAYHGMMHHVDLMTTFFGLAGGDVAALKALDADLDGEDHWPALLGETTSPRSELVLNLPRSTTWSPGENATDEGVALRVGKYKLLTNHPKDYWFSPHPGPDYHPPTMMLASECKLGFYDHFKAAKCEYGDYLFDLDDDPTEKKNLWDEDSLHLRQVKASLLVRAQTLTAAQGHYGKILAEAVNHGPSLEETLAAVNSDYVVPWKCDIVS